MKLLVPKLKIEKDEGFSKNDLFERKNFGERLANLLENVNEELVVALDAPWGEGKSTFIKMWQGYVEYHRENKIKTIYFDAFANDYQKDPFLALASEIYSHFENKSKEKKEEYLDKAKEVGKALFKGGLNIGIKTVTNNLLDGTVLDDNKSDISNLFSKQLDKVIVDRITSNNENKLAIENFKNYLEKIVKEDNNSSLVFIIDELDRCRPSFALELIEQIKHIFSVKGISFLLVVNREQVESSIKYTYGSEINASMYLQKFINIWLRLPQRSRYRDDLKQIYLENILEKMLEAKVNKNKTIVNFLKEIIEYYNLSFREIEKILTNIAIIYNSGKVSEYVYHYQLIISFVSYLRVCNPNTYENILNKVATSVSILEELKLEKEKIESSYLYDLSKLIEYIVFFYASEEEKNKLIENEEVYFERGRLGRHGNIILEIANNLSSLKMD